jgi:hypothetical protein
MRAQSDDLLVLSIVADGDANTVTIQDGDERVTFGARFCEVDGIRLLNMPELETWLQERGKYPWGMVRVAELIVQTSREDVTFPLRLVLDEGAQD